MTDASAARSTISTLEAAEWLGLSVRSVQLMVDRGELAAWKTPGGHRRIQRDSVERWLSGQGLDPAVTQPAPLLPRAGARGIGHAAPAAPARVLLIEDSKHFQTLIGLLVRQQFPQVELHIADDGFAGLAMAGQLAPDVLLVDLLLPGIDGATLISSLASHPQFKGLQLVVVTSLDEAAREPYAFALQGLPVVHKPQVVKELPALLSRLLANRGHA